MKKSSVSLARRFTYFHILCYALKRWARTHNQILSGKTGWRGSRVHLNTELWTQLMVSQWNSSGIFSQDSPLWKLCNKVQEFMSKMSIQPEEFTGRIIFMSTFNYIFMEISRQWTGMRIKRQSRFLFTREDFHQEDGHFSDLDQKRSAVLLMIANHKENGPVSLHWWW